MTITDFKTALLAKDPIHINREVQACNWFYGDTEVFHERTRVPWSPFKQMTSSYWPSIIYTDKALADKEAATHGGRVTECFYCDPASPIWFISFADFDQAANYVFNWMQNNGKLTP